MKATNDGAHVICRRQLVPSHLEKGSRDPWSDGSDFRYNSLIALCAITSFKIPFLCGQRETHKLISVRVHVGLRPFYTAISKRLTE